MKERLRRIFCCLGMVGTLSVFGSIPVMADTTDDNGISYNWSDKAAANVITYANIRENADINSKCVGRLPSGAIATVTGTENGWIQITSGEVEGYIREDLLLYGDDAKNLYEALYGMGVETVEAQNTEVWDENIEMQVNADESSQKVSAEVIQTAGISGSDLDLMAAIIECEAGGESYEGKIGVGAVIMNRIRSSQFPNTLSEVIYQNGQFEPVWTGKLSTVLSRGANADCYAAAQDVFAGANTIGERLFFHAGSGNGLTIGNQTFY